MLTSLVSDLPGVNVRPVYQGTCTVRNVATKDWRIAFADWDPCLFGCPADVQEWCLQRKDWESKGLSRVVLHAQEGVSGTVTRPCSLSSLQRSGPFQQLLLLSRGSFYSIHRIIFSCV